MNFSRISSVGEALRDATQTFKTNVALIEIDRDREKARYTYREFSFEAERFAALLQEKGVTPHDRVAILMTNQSKWLISATAVFWSGGTLVPIDYKLTPAEQLALLKHSKPKILIVEYPIFQKLKDSTPSCAIIVTEAPENADLNSALRWETKPKSAFQYRTSDREDIACIVYSSGTGGTPKGCMLSHGNYLSQAEPLSRMYPMTEDEVYFSILPTNHAIDFMCGFFLPLNFGATVVHQRTLRPEFLASTMKRYGVTHMALVPMILKALKGKFEEGLQKQAAWKRNLIHALTSFNAAVTERRPNHRLSKLLLKPVHDQLGGRLKLLFAGGAFVDPLVAQYFYNLGLPVVIGYGLTEAGTVLTVNDLRPFRSDTVGKPIPGVEIDIRNRNHEGAGEIWVKGPTVMKGYLEDPELTNETIVDGWLRTGDVGFCDASGHLKLVGRSKNMIVTEGGKNIYPEDVEVHFENLNTLQEFCVFSSSFVWPSGRLSGEKLIAVVKPRSDAPDGAWLKDLHERNLRLADYKRLGGYLIWDRDFPRTASMKIKRSELAKEVASATSANALKEFSQ